MKKCPTCEKTFEDSMRFCQSDGSPLVAVEEVIDPYKTMVARPGEIAAAMPPVETPKVETPDPFVPPHEEGEVLEIPQAVDPNKTMFVSEADLRREMEADSKPEDPVIEMPPAADTPAPPAFIDADLNPVNVPPPAPVAENPDPTSRPRPEPPVGNLTSPPIPSPFSSSGKNASDVSPMMPQFKEPPPKVETPSSIPSFDEPESAASSGSSPATGGDFEPPMASPSPFQAQTPASPFSTPSPSQPFNPPPVVVPKASTPQNQQMAQAEWTPPPVPAATSSKPKENNMTPPGNVAAGQSKTLAIISLVVGILSLCCGSFFIPGIAAIVLGFVAKGKASKDPMHFGGGGLALGGIICGALSLILGVIGIIVYIIWGAAILANGGRY